MTTPLTTDELAEQLKNDKADDLATATGYDLDVALAYIELVGYEYADAEGLQDSYSGQFGSDEEFAENLASEVGLINEEAAWPNNYIDWERAARDLMMDYSEQDGHYFRSI